jgi:hypothetical protein
MKKLLFLAPLAALLFFGGCGYTTSSALPSDYRTIYVAPFKNDIDFTSDTNRQVYFPLLEVKVRAAVINRFLFDGHLKIADESRADLVLTGDLTHYNRQALRYTSNNDVLEYRSQIVVHLVLKDRAGEIVWEEPSFGGEGTYFVSGPQIGTEDAAVQDATTDLARRIVERTIENW